MGRCLRHDSEVGLNQDLQDFMINRIGGMDLWEDVFDMTAKGFLNVICLIIVKIKIV